MKEINAKEINASGYGGTGGYHRRGYHWVKVAITRRPSGLWAAELIESRGRIYEQEDHRRTIYAMASGLDDLVHKLRRDAEASGVRADYLVEALSQAHHDAALAEDES